MQKTSTKRVQDYIWQGGEGDPLGIVQEIEISPFYQIVYTQTRIRSGEWGTKFSGILRYKQITKSRTEDQI